MIPLRDKLDTRLYFVPGKINGSNSEDYLVDSGGDGEDDASTSLLVVL